MKTTFDINFDFYGVISFGLKIDWTNFSLY